jgi:hypothetical protein
VAPTPAGERSFSGNRHQIHSVSHFLAWYEQEEHALLTLEALTPIALIGYRNELQHEQHKSISTINLRISALRAWCGWMTEQGYLAADPAAHVKLVGGEASSSRKGLKSAQINQGFRPLGPLQFYSRTGGHPHAQKERPTSPFVKGSGNPSSWCIAEACKPDQASGLRTRIQSSSSQRWR